MAIPVGSKQEQSEVNSLEQQARQIYGKPQARKMPRATGRKMGRSSGRGCR